MRSPVQRRAQDLFLSWVVAEGGGVAGGSQTSRLLKTCRTRVAVDNVIILITKNHHRSNNHAEATEVAVRRSVL